MSTVLAILAVYRIAHMLARENGPADLFARLRTFVADRYGDDSWQADGVACPLCLSFWLSFAIPLAPTPIITVFAIAGGVLLIHRVIDGISPWGG
jgi:hypothetical protein